MTRIPRSYIEGALFYVTARGDHNEELFRDEEDYSTYIGLLKKYKEQYGFKLFAYSLLQNHLHLLIELKEGLTISDIMHDLNANYTKYFNGRYERKGHLFQERYKLVLAEKKSYLLALAAYIHLEPQMLNLASSPNQYRYSNCSAGNFPELDLARERQELGSQDYLRMFPKGEMKILKDDLRKKSILGSREFIEEIKKAAAKRNTSLKNLTPKHQFRNLVLTATAAVIFLGIFSFYFYANKPEPKDSKEIEKIEEKYRTNMDTYYKEMAKTLQIERQKAKFLEEKVQGGEIRK